MLIADKIVGAITGGFNVAFQGIRKTLVDSFSMVTSYHNESMKFARSAGMTLQQANAYTKVLTNRAAELGVKYGIAAREVQELERSLQKAVGRQLMLSHDQAEKMVQINKLVGESASSMYSEEMVTKMGAQIDTVQGAIAKAYATAAKSGLNAEKMTQKVAQNLGMANRLSFRNGIDGLTRMAMLSEKMGINMQSVESAAGQFMELDKAIENAAHLQMLGGSAGAMFGNPLTAAYEANYDPEAFAKRMSDSLASYATFDASKGISNINGMNMDFVRNIAKAMGISAEEASSMAKKQAEVRYKENTYGTTLDAMSGGDQMKRDMLLNKTTIQNGMLGMVDKNQQWHEMSYYQSGEGKKEMEDMMSMYGKSDSEIMQEQAMRLKGIDETLSGIWTSITGKIGEVLADWDVLPRIQNFIDKHGKEIVEKVGVVAKQVAEKLPEWWRNIVSSYESFKGMIKWAGLGIMGLLSAMLAKDIWSIGKNLFKFGSRAGSAARGIGGGLKSLVTRPFTFVGSGLKEAGSALKSAKGMYSLSRSTGGGVWQSLKYGAKEIPRLAKGGYLKNAIRLGKSGGIGIAGALGNMAVDSYFDKNPDKKGSALHYGGKMAATAAEYGAIGSMFGPIGTGIGAAVGAVKGAYDTWKSLPENADKNFLDYAKSVGEGIVDGAKAVGEKLGSAASWAGEKIGGAMSWIGNEIKERGGILSVLFKSITAPLRGFAASIEGIAKFIIHPIESAKKIFNSLTNNPLGKLANFVFGKKEPAKKYAIGGVAYGGEPGRDSIPALLTPGERVLTNDQYQSLVKPKPTGGREYIYKPGGTSVSNVNGNKITVKDFNVNISGTIKIDAGKNFANVDASTLLRDQAFVNQLKNIIKESINNDMNGGRYMNDLATRRGQTTSTSIVGKL